MDPDEWDGRARDEDAELVEECVGGIERTVMLERTTRGWLAMN